jgi:hypothetical protein
VLCCGLAGCGAQWPKWDWVAAANRRQIRHTDTNKAHSLFWASADRSPNRFISLGLKFPNKISCCAANFCVLLISYAGSLLDKMGGGARRLYISMSAMWENLNAGCFGFNFFPIDRAHNIGSDPWSQIMLRQYMKRVAKQVRGFFIQHTRSFDVAREFTNYNY